MGCLGFILGAAVGICLVGAFIYLLRKPVSDGLGEGYKGWEMYAFLSAGPPTALLTGWLARNLIKYTLMLLTALLGAAVAVGCLETRLACSGMDLDAVNSAGVQLCLFGALGALESRCAQNQRKLPIQASPRSASHDASESLERARQVISTISFVYRRTCIRLPSNERVSFCMCAVRICLLHYRANWQHAQCSCMPKLMLYSY